MQRDEMVSELNLLYLQAYKSENSFLRLAANVLSQIIRGFGAQVASNGFDLILTEPIDEKDFVSAVRVLASHAGKPSTEMSFSIVRIALLHVALMVEIKRVTT